MSSLVAKYRKVILRNIVNDDTNKDGLLNLAKMFDQSACIEDQNLVFPNFKRKPPNQNIKCHKPTRISTLNIANFSKGDEIPFNQWTHPLDSRFGLIEDSYNLSIRLIATPSSELKQVIEGELLPFLDNFQCRYFIPITQMSNNTYYRQIRLIRFFFLIARDGYEAFRRDFENGKNENRKAGEPPSDYSPAIESLLPDPLKLFSWIETLTRFAPVLPTIPFRRLVHGQVISWHFIPEDLSHQNHLVSTSLYDTTFFGLEPFRNQYGLPLSKSFPSNRRSHQLMKLGTSIVDRISSEFWSLDFWANKEGEVNLSDIVNGLAALSLLFADISALVKNESFFERFTWATGILDKLSNLAISVLIARGKQINGGFEYTLSKKLCSRRIAIWSEKTIAKRTQNLLLNDLSDELCSNIRMCH